MIEIKENNIEPNTKEEIISLLKGTQVPGIDRLIEHMENHGFFSSPCSGKYHLAVCGGLAEHSLNVYHIMKELAESLCVGNHIKDENIILCALLHDLGKMGDHGKPNYVEKMVRSKSKNKETGEYDMVRSAAEPFETNKELHYIDHEVRSVIIAERYIELNEEEEFAILYHNGMYGTFKYQLSGKETELYMLLHFADMWASRVKEV